ncbi:MAG: glutaminyl-peptide cyclotransferase [Acidimicrobiales bacterium]
MRSPWLPRTVLATAICLASSCGSDSTIAEDPEPVTTTTTQLSSPQTSTADDAGVEPLTGSIQYTVVGSYPHDSAAFTQGLEFVGDQLYESTGRRGESDRRITDPETGEVLALVPLDQALFGEGMTERDGRLYQLTFTSGQLLISDTESLAEVATPVRYDGEGWGLCVNEAEPARPFVMSNGTAQLTIRDAESFQTQRTVTVVDGAGSPVELLNELECLDGWVLANVWRSDIIVAIDLMSGAVIGVLDLSDLVPTELDNDGAVLNGIAYRAETDTFFVTGKLWPVTYELRLSSSSAG